MLFVGLFVQPIFKTIPYRLVRSRTRNLGSDDIDIVRVILSGNNTKVPSVNLGVDDTSDGSPKLSRNVAKRFT